MAILIDKVTKERSTGDTNDAKASGKYWVFTNASDPLLSTDLTYYKDVDGSPVEMTAEEKAVIDANKAAIVAGLVATEYRRKREAEYPSIKEVSVALWEKVVEGKPESADLLQTKRLAVKAKYPKPI